MILKKRKVENREYLKIKIRGSITIFATLCLLIFISSLLVIVQVTAVKTGVHEIDRATILANESILSEFNKNIFENYHILVMDAGFGDSTIDEAAIKNRLSNYISGTGNDENYSNLLGWNYKEIRDVELTYITDRNGLLFVDNVVQYMKYKVTADFVKKYLEKFGIFKGNKQVIESIKRKQEVAKSAQELNEDVMEFYSIVDGMKVKKASFVYDKDGDLEFNDSFVKVIAYDSSEWKNLGYSNAQLFKKRRLKSYSMKKILGLIEEKCDSWLEAIDKNDKDKQKRCKDYCDKRKKKILERIDVAIKCYDKALARIENIEKKKKEYDKDCEKYKSYIENNKEKLPQGVYDNLKNDNSDNALIDKIVSLKPIIIQNKALLLEIKKLKDLKFENNEDSIKNAINQLEQYQKKAMKYSLEDFDFEYEDGFMEIEKDNFFESIESIFENGIIELVSDSDKLSKQKLIASNYPSKELKNISHTSISDILEDALSTDISELIEGIKDILDELDKGGMATYEIASDSAKDMIEDVLFNQYVVENFSSYSNTVTKASIDNRLAYEMEYLICGNTTDMANIKNIANRLVMIRMLCDYIAIITDKSKIASAHTIATATLGIIGIPPLVEIAAVAIEFLWAYEEAIVDVSAVMKGYYVPVFKGSKGIKITANDLFVFGKNIVNKKSESYAKNQNTALNMGYQQYLELFLILENKTTKSYRCMDLIQANINNSFVTNMRIKNCIYGIKSKTVFDINYNYANMEWMKKILINNKNKGIYESVTESSY